MTRATRATTTLTHVIIIDTGARAVVAHVVGDRAVGRQLLRKARRLLPKHARFVHVVAQHGVAVGVGGRAAVQALRAAQEDDGAVARVQELAVGDGAALDVVAEEDAVAAHLVEKDARHGDVLRVLHHDGGPAVHGPVAAARHLVHFQVGRARLRDGKAREGHIDYGRAGRTTHNDDTVEQRQRNGGRGQTHGNIG